MNKLAKKELFNNCKQELKNRRNITTYFNMKFFDDFLEYKRLAFLESEDNSYFDKMDKQLKEKIFTSDFYNKNSPCYCEFLCVAYRRKNEFKRVLGMAS